MTARSFYLHRHAASAPRPHDLDCVSITKFFLSLLTLPVVVWFSDESAGDQAQAHC